LVCHLSDQCCVYSFATSRPQPHSKMTRSHKSFFPHRYVVHVQRLLTEIVRLRANSNPVSRMVNWIWKNNGEYFDSGTRVCPLLRLNRCESYFPMFELNPNRDNQMFSSIKITCLPQFPPHKSREPIQTNTRSDLDPNDATQAGQKFGHRDRRSLL
jgi:hypothetical protein